MLKLKQKNIIKESFIMNNIPKVKIGIAAVSRRGALVEAYAAKYDAAETLMG